MIKGLLLDYGGVIKPFERPDKPRYDALERILGIDSVTLASNSTIAEIWHPYVKGDLHPEDFATAIGTYTRTTLTADQHCTIAEIKNHQPYPDMIELLDRLRTQSIEVGVISNISESLAKQSRDHGDYDAVDFAILSAEHGTRKPDMYLYQQAYAHFESNPSPDEILYVDDTARHLVPAHELGFHTLHIASDMYPVAPFIEHTLRTKAQL